MAKNQSTDETELGTGVPAVGDARQARWDAFLAKAREVNPERFDAQKANHEFDTIPDSFL